MPLFRLAAAEKKGMIKIHHYAQNKFNTFSEKQQLKAIIEQLTALEANLTDPQFRRQIITSILDCLKWSSAPVKEKLQGLEQITEDASTNEILELITPFLRAFKPDYNARVIDVIRYDGLKLKAGAKVPFPLTVIADDLRSEYNLGSIFRTAECVQAKQIYLCGITPKPPFKNLAKSALGTEERVPYKTVANALEAIKEVKDKGFPVLALETVSGARSIFDYQPKQSVAVIVGNEALGIEESVLRLADEVLAIPVYGWKNSLNVSNAFTLAAYWLSGIITDRNSIWQL